MIYLQQNLETYQSDFRQMLQAFFPGEKIVLHPEGTRLRFQADFSDSVFLRLWENETCVAEETVICEYQDRKASRNVIKAGAYRLLSRYTKKASMGEYDGCASHKVCYSASRGRLDG